jgi:hypothetical protein
MAVRLGWGYTVQVRNVTLRNFWGRVGVQVQVQVPPPARSRLWIFSIPDPGVKKHRNTGFRIELLVGPEINRSASHPNTVKQVKNQDELFTKMSSK